MDVLTEIIGRKRERVAEAKERVPLNEVQRVSKPHALRAALRTEGMNIIAEFKRQSPSRGIINSNADVAEVTVAYTLSGASGLSILTDGYFFGGSFDDLKNARINNIPILRKDFMIDEYQVAEARAMGADVILSPSAWAVPTDHDNAKAPYGQEWRECYVPVAREFGLWVVGVSNVGPITGGPWAGRRCIGCSLVIGPGGREVIQGPYGEDAETVLHVDVQPHRRDARGSGWTNVPGGSAPAS